MVVTVFLSSRVPLHTVRFQAVTRTLINYDSNGRDLQRQFPAHTSSALRAIFQKEPPLNYDTSDRPAAECLAYACV